MQKYKYKSYAYLNKRKNVLRINILLENNEFDFLLFNITIKSLDDIIIEYVFHNNTTEIFEYSEYIELINSHSKNIYKKYFKLI
ncbi:hypothetical protein [Cetobacterium sp.]|uniref:hypothetical protein n=1 Tax=Cetobacterium sp. TaxID=2071632 RepID=UPI003F3A3B10